jgi:hypothetical protein
MEELMRTAIATGLILISAGWASAQTSAPQDAAAPAKTVTMTGCVAGTAGAQSFTLSNAAIVPADPKTTADSSEPSPVPTSASATPTQPAGSGSTASGATAGAAGTEGNVVPASAGTSGAVAKEPSGGTYRLSGTDMTPWAGKRVQTVGTIVQADAKASNTAAPMEFRVQSVQSIPGSCPQQ